LVSEVNGDAGFNPAQVGRRDDPNPKDTVFRIFDEYIFT
jgi:hypothetical protein